MRDRAADILAVNTIDVLAFDGTAPMRDRLTLDPHRIENMGIRPVRAV